MGGGVSFKQNLNLLSFLEQDCWEFKYIQYPGILYSMLAVSLYKLHIIYHNHPPSPPVGTIWSPCQTGCVKLRNWKFWT